MLNALTKFAFHFIRTLLIIYVAYCALFSPVVIAGGLAENQEFGALMLISAGLQSIFGLLIIDRWDRLKAKFG